jgi:hypothetical protein
MALTDKLTNIADAIRDKTGGTDLLTLDEMAQTIRLLQTVNDDVAACLFVDQNGYELKAALVDSDAELTATSNDIRIGTTAVTNDGITDGEKFIPAYHTSEGVQIVLGGRPFKITTLTDCRYTKLQVLICEFNSSIEKSVSTEKVVIEDRLYDVKSDTSISEITIDETDKSIDLGIINNEPTMRIIRYFLYKENE